MQQNYREIPKNKVGTRLSILARLLNGRNSKFVLNELSEIAFKFLPTYRRTVSDDPVTEEELVAMEEFLEEYEEYEIEDIIDQTFEAIYFDMQVLKEQAMEVLLRYSEEPKENFGNRINLLADLTAVSRKLDFSREDSKKFTNFVKHELVSIAKVIGNDY